MSVTWQRVLNPTVLTPHSWTSILQNYAKQISVVYKLPGLWYLVTAAWTD